MQLRYADIDEKGRVVGSKYPQEKVQIVIEKYLNHTIAECAEFSGLSKAIVYKIARENGIEKSKEFKQKGINHFIEISKNTRFKKGQAEKSFVDLTFPFFTRFLSHTLGIVENFM